MKAFLKKISLFLLKNLKMLIVSVALSIIIWFAVSIQIFPNIYDHIDDIPVTAEPTAYMQNENLYITDYTKSVSIQIQGKRYDIGTLTADDFIASLDLSSITTPGEHIVNVELKRVETSNECEIITSGLTASVTVERRISKEIALEVNTSGITIGDELQIQEDDIVFSSQTITVSGEESLVNSVARAVIEPSYDGIMTETTEIRGDVSLYKEDGTKIDDSELEYQSGNYSVTIPVYRVKTLPLNISINYPANFSADSLQYTILPKEITIAAPANDSGIENLEKIDVGEVDLSDVTSRDLQGIKLTITLPTGYKNLSQVSIAQVSFENVDSYSKREFSVSTNNFTVLNGDSQYNYEFVTSQIDVTAVGPSDVLYGLASDDIIGTVNMLGNHTEEGVKNMTVTLRIAGQNVTAWITGDYKVDIRTSLKEESEE